MASQNDVTEASAAQLARSETCGEDLAHNLAVVSGLARRYCATCADYHVLFVARRAVQPQLVESDRTEIAAAVEQFARSRPEQSSQTVLIGGAADTGVLATAAHGIARIGAAALAATRFVVLDRCGTPLALCRDYAERISLTLATETVDVVEDDANRSVDLVVIHSLFRQLPEGIHVATLRKLSAWLAPGGRVIFSHRLEDDGDRGRRPAEREETRLRIRRAVEAGRLTLGETLEDFEARLARRNPDTSVHRSRYAGPDALMALFASAGLKIHSCAVNEGAGDRRRILAILGMD